MQRVCSDSAYSTFVMWGKIVVLIYVRRTKRDLIVSQSEITNTLCLCRSEKRLRKHVSHACKCFFFSGGWMNWNIVSDVYIFTKGKIINAGKERKCRINSHTGILWSIVCVVQITVCKQKTNCIGATDTCYYKMQTAADCRMQSADRIQNVG